VRAALAAIIPRASTQAHQLDIARDLLDPDSSSYCGLQDGAALERQDRLLRSTRRCDVSGGVAAPPDRTIYDASRDPSLI